ncbi:MAG: TetR/AcrR family transcriptional regulator [Kiloniellaceae bacterium]
MTSSRRDKLIDTALALFDRKGYHATGIDRILAEAGVAKMTLYKHFGSKDELILAALRRRDARWRQWFKEAVESRAEAPRERLLAVFDALEEWLAGPDFHGCMFVKAASEYCAHDDPIHAAAAEHHRHVLSDLRELAAAAGAARPAKLARELMLLIEGAIVVTQVNGPVGAAKQARKAAQILIDDALAPTAAQPPAGCA